MIGLRQALLPLSEQSQNSSILDKKPKYCYTKWELDYKSRNIFDKMPYQMISENRVSNYYQLYYFSCDKVPKKA